MSINIRTEANRMEKRPTKKACFEIVSKYIDGGVMTEIEKAVLYSFFIPQVSKKPKNSAGWVKLAIDPKEIRTQLHCVHVDAEGTMVGTDGRRLHLRKNSGYEAGNYDTEMKPLSHDIYFPDYKQVIPKYESSHIIEQDPDLCMVNGIQSYQYNNGLYFQKDLVDQAMLGMSLDKENETVLFCIDNKLIFTSGDNLAVVMNLIPKRIKT